MWSTRRTAQIASMPLPWRLPPCGCRRALWPADQATPFTSKPQAKGKRRDERTRAYYAETLPNPKLTAFPIAEMAKIGRERWTSQRHP